MLEGFIGVIELVGDPISEQTTSKNGRIAYAEAQFDRVIYDKDRDAVVAVQDAQREHSSAIHAYSVGKTYVFRCDGRPTTPPIGTDRSAERPRSS